METKRILIKLLGIMFLGIIVLGCTKKNQTAIEASEQAQKENIAVPSATGENFFFGIETGNGPEYPQFVVDSGGNSFTFHRNKQLKDIRLISIGMSEDGKLYEDNVYAYALEETGFYTNIGFYEEGKRYEGNVSTSVPNEIGSFFVMVSVSEGIPTRGIAFTDENGKRKYFYISMSGMDGLPLLNEFQNTAKPQTSSADLQNDYSKILKGDLSDFAGIWGNGFSERRRLMPNGTFHVIDSNETLTAGNFSITEYGSYHWIEGSEFEDVDIGLYPVGVEVYGYINGIYEAPGLIQTDTTKVRMFESRNNMPSNADQIYYLE